MAPPVEFRVILGFWHAWLSTPDTGHDNSGPYSINDLGSTEPIFCLLMRRSTNSDGTGRGGRIDRALASRSGDRGFEAWWTQTNDL